MHASTILILPVTSFAFSEPFDRSRDALLARRVLLRLGDPFEIVALRRWRKAIEYRLGFRRVRERLGEFRMQLRRRLGLMLGLARRGRHLRKIGGFAD